jgi:hypothetical protein
VRSAHIVPFRAGAEGGATRDFTRKSRGAKKKGYACSVTLVFDGRGEKIRTSDPLHPMQVRYQAALRPDRERNCIRTEGPDCRERGNRRRTRYSLSSILRMLFNSLRMLAGEMGWGTVMVLYAAWDPVRDGRDSSRRFLAPLMVKPCS